jgi:hypothetical protein
MTIHFSEPKLVLDINGRDSRPISTKLFGFYRFLREGQERPCETLSVSLDAISFRAAGRGTPGDHVVAQLDLFDKIEGRITRYTPEGFVMTLWLEAGHRARVASRLDQLLNRGATHTNQRRDIRIVPLTTVCDVVFADGTRHTIKIVDVSRSGAALTSMLCPPIRSRLTVGSRTATVVRHITEGFAVEFDERIPPTAFDEKIIL